MNFVIPMAGKGDRFVSAGYKLPKYLIEVNGKTLLQYSLESLPLEIANKLIFILLKEHIEHFSVIEKITTLVNRLGFPRQCQFVELDQVTKGQSETVLRAKHLFDVNQDLLIYNIDTHFKSSSLKALLESDAKKDGVLGVFKDTQDKWSFAKVANGVVTETAEKIVISDNALTGLYHFTRPSDFIRVAEKAILKEEKHKGEYYIAPLYNYLINEGKEFVIDRVDTFLPLGTPEDLKKIL